MSEKPKCPHCGIDGLDGYQVYWAGLKEWGKELSQPWLLSRVFYKMKLRYIDGMPDIYPNLQCKSCKHFALYCPKCSKAWEVAKPLEHLEHVKCKHCNTEFFYNMG